MNRLPGFSFDDYQILLESFKDSDYRFGRICDKDTAYKTVYLRHDVDFFLSGWERIPQLEHATGAVATYYILVGQYDITAKRKREAIEMLTSLGHDIGLHYDTRQYPEDHAEAEARLYREILLLEQITGQSVRSITRHNVFNEKRQPVMPEGLIDPYDPAYLHDMMYISDSVRSWRDERLLSCFGDRPPHQVVLLTHPESWLNGDIKNRIDYLKQIIFPRISGLDELKNELMQIWSTHEATRLHDAREAGVLTR